MTILIPILHEDALNEPQSTQSRRKISRAIIVKGKLAENWYKPTTQPFKSIQRRVPKNLQESAAILAASASASVKLSLKM